MYIAEAVTTKNKATMSQLVQKRLVSNPYAAMRLVIPSKPMCGGKPLRGNMMRRISPAKP